ncbi:hypothetical protein SpCBS45565_g08352 [Spizellomyces sp. 'palustris']|nr:hypothetical protein SpCBS45565_g08352 [Spizellomyces sp. 'palustris']
MWSAVYTLFCLWGVAWLIAYLFRSLVTNRKGTGTAGTLGQTESGGTVTGNNVTGPGKHPMHWRATSAARIAQTSFLMALAATTISEFGYGITRAAAGLLWAFFALAVLHILVAASVRNFGVPIAFGLPQFILIVIIIGLAFRD